MALSRSVDDFVEEVGGLDAGPVCVRGGATQWLVGGRVQPGTREVVAPAGIVTYEPAEMTVRVGAGTTVAELHEALAVHRQTTVLSGAPPATVGGVLCVGRNGLASARDGRVRDVLLQAAYASAEGRRVVAGGPTVKNVTGFDLCRLLVGSIGTLGLIGEVILRTRPQPEVDAWLSGMCDPFALHRLLYRPASTLWDGTTTWVHLEGYAADVTAQLQICATAGLARCGGPPDLPPYRYPLRPVEVTTLPRQRDAVGPFVAEIGVGVVHTTRPPTQRRIPSAEVIALHERLRDQFDRTRRLNPGRDPLACAETHE